MDESSDLKALHEAVDALRGEVLALRSEVEELKKPRVAWEALSRPADVPKPAAAGTFSTTTVPDAIRAAGASRPPIPLPKPACRRCGAVLPDDGDFCDQCGAPIRGGPTATTSPAPTRDASAEKVPAPAARAIPDAPPGRSGRGQGVQPLPRSLADSPARGSALDPAAAPGAAIAPGTAAAENVPAAALSTEQYIGQKLLHYVGIVLVAMGVLFFLLWRAAHAGPEERVLMSSATGAALVLLGQYLKKRPPYDQLSNAVVGGGWTILYLTAYAAYHFPGTRVVGDAGTELVLLAGAAAGMILHALSLNSAAFRLYSFGLTYFIFLISGQDVLSFEGFLMLVAASAAVAVVAGHADILVVSVIGFFCNYLPVFLRVVETPEGARSVAAFLTPISWLAGGYLILAVLPFVPRARRSLLSSGERKVFDAALSLNAVFFAGVAGAMAWSYFHHATLERAAVASLFFVLPGIGYLATTPKDFMPGQVCAVLGLLALAAGIFSMPSPLWKMFAWIAAATTWVWIGLLFEHPAWRISGLCMSMLSFALFLYVATRDPADRTRASAAMFVFSALGYLASRYYRSWLTTEPEEWERPAMEYWLYVGSAALLLGLWGVMDPAPLAVTLAALAVLGEFAAVYFGRRHLWGQATALMLGVGAYTFFIDYGPNLPIAAGVTPRLLTSLCVVAAMAYLYYSDPTPAEFADAWGHWSRRSHRTALSWMTAAVGAFAVYHEFDPRTRLPLWSLGTTALYFLGRYRDEEHLKAQAMALAAATAVEGVVSYLLAPAALLGAASGREAALYWGSAVLLLVNLSAAKDVKRPQTPADRQAAWLLCALALGMMALYLAKELESTRLTLAWSAEGIVFLLMGMALGYSELRLPSLFLLGLCVAKAMLLDTSQLPLPDRVATFLVLGLILIAASMLYVRAGKHVEKNPPPGAP